VLNQFITKEIALQVMLSLLLLPYLIESVFKLKENKIQDYLHKLYFLVMKRKIMDVKEEPFLPSLIMLEEMD